MTIAGTGPRVQFEDVESAVEALREQRLRVTMARRTILQALFAAEGAPLSVETIVRSAGEQGNPLDAASVYRNLETFEQAGVARHVHLGHGPGLYALVGEGEREYLYCESCGTAQALPPERLDELRMLLCERFAFVARFTHFPIVGLCADCIGAHDA